MFTTSLAAIMSGVQLDTVVGNRLDLDVGLVALEARCRSFRTFCS